MKERAKVGIGGREYVGLLNSTKSLRELHGVLEVNGIEFEGQHFPTDLQHSFVFCGKLKPCHSVLVLTVLD